MNKKVIPLLIAVTGGLVLLAKSSKASYTDDTQDVIPPFASPTDFIKLYYPFAKRYSAGGKIPPLFTIAQAGVETGWGTSNIFMHDKNLFGIKSGSGWKDYATVEDSFKDHEALLSKDPRYAAAFDPLNANDPYSFAQIIAPIYTPDKGYIDLLTATMKKISPIIS